MDAQMKKKKRKKIYNYHIQQPITKCRKRETITQVTYGAIITLLPKLDKGSMRKKNSCPIFTHE